jgi:localization factor PodJL
LALDAREAGAKRAASRLDPRAEAAAKAQAAEFAAMVRIAEHANNPRDKKLAAQWFELAAQQGLATAQYRLAVMLETGAGLPRDRDRAEALYLAAAEQGNTRAMHNLGVLAADGADGKPDYASAANWFEKAAEFGIADSQFNLAILLSRGLGRLQDLPRAYSLFTILANAGDAEAAKKRDETATRMNAAEITVAKAAAAAFQPRPIDALANEMDSPKQDASIANAPHPVKPGKPKLSGL